MISATFTIRNESGLWPDLVSNQYPTVAIWHMWDSGQANCKDMMEMIMLLVDCTSYAAMYDAFKRSKSICTAFCEITASISEHNLIDCEVTVHEHGDRNNPSNYNWLFEVGEHIANKTISFAGRRTKNV